MRHEKYIAFAIYPHLLILSEKLANKGEGFKPDRFYSSNPSFAFTVVTNKNRQRLSPSSKNHIEIFI